MTSVFGAAMLGAIANVGSRLLEDRLLKEGIYGDCEMVLSLEGGRTRTSKMHEQACPLYTDPGRLNGADGMAERAVYTAQWNARCVPRHRSTEAISGSIESRDGLDCCCRNEKGRSSADGALPFALAAVSEVGN